MSSSLSSRHGIQRRSVQSPSIPISSGSYRPDIETPPKPWPLAQFLALGCLIFLGFLQFLPATHYRDPSDPFRRWVPFDSSASSSSLNSKASNSGDSDVIKTNNGIHEMIHVVSWMDCLDLRVLAVLINSTLSNSRYPDRIHFHFFIPEGHKDKVPYYKLKVLFPMSNLDILGQEEVKGKMNIDKSLEEFAEPYFYEIAPFVIPSTHSSLRKFIYVSPYIIVKGRIEELFGLELSNYAIAAAEDCRKRLSSYVNFDVLDAIQRSASKPWVSLKPYERAACMPDLRVLSIDARRLEKDLLEAILWWSKVLNIGNERSQTNPAIVLGLHNRYVKLSPSWMVGDSVLSGNDDENKVLHFDGPKNACSAHGSLDRTASNLGNLWKNYLPPMSDQILSR